MKLKTACKNLLTEEFLGINSRTNDVFSLRKQFQFINIIQYGDDTTLCVKGETNAKLEVKSYLHLNEVIQFFVFIRFVFNFKSSNNIHFYLMLHGEEPPILVADDTLIKEVNSATFFECTSIKVLPGATKLIVGFQRLQQVSMSFLDNLPCTSLLPGCTKNIILGLIHPHLLDGIWLWGNFTQSKLTSVFRLQKR